MKSLFLILLTLFSFNAFSQGSDKGGHDGSGGNICFVKNHTVCVGGKCKTFTGYRLVEEIQYSQYSSLPSMVRYYPHPLPLVKSKINEKVSHTNLAQTTAGRRAKTKLTKAFSFDPDLRNNVLQFFDILRMSYVIQNRFGEAYDVGLEVRSRCEPSSIEAAIRTNSQGVVILSQTAWNKLPVESQEALLIHETLRFAQLYTSWFKDVSNQELQRITMLVMKNKRTTLERHQFYRAFQKENYFYYALRLKDLKFLMGDACSNFEDVCASELKVPHLYSRENILDAYQLTAERSIEERDFAQAIQKLLGRARLLKKYSYEGQDRYESEELNKLRIHSETYRNEIEQNIVDEFNLN